MEIPENAVPEGFTLVAIFFMLNPGTVRLRELSDIGANEVTAASQSAFGTEVDEVVSPKISFVAAFYGDRPETQDTVRVALRAINHPDIEVAQRGAFDVGALMSGGDPIERAKDILRLSMTVMSGQYAGKPAGDATVPTFLVSFPAPRIAYAADDAGSLGKIGPADIVVYYISRSAKGVHHFHAVRWPCLLNE